MTVFFNMNCHPLIMKNSSLIKYLMAPSSNKYSSRVKEIVNFYKKMNVPKYSKIY